jgi:hypothetical protein
LLVLFDKNLFDKTVPVGARRFLSGRVVHTVVEMGRPDQLENGEFLKVAEQQGFHDVMATSDQNIRRRQNPPEARRGGVGSKTWPVVRQHGRAVGRCFRPGRRGSHQFRLPASIG